MRSEYLLLLLLVLIVPLIFSFDRKLNLFRKTIPLLSAIMAVSVPYWAWDFLATARGHWSFNPRHTLGVIIGNLPLEEMLFFPVIAFVSIFTWEVIKYYGGRGK